jgi:hypothetical protein
MHALKLDPSRLLGFRLDAKDAIAAKAGGKAGPKAGSKAGSKFGQKLGAKAGNKNP